MRLDNVKIAVPKNSIGSWQEIVNVLAEVTHVPAALSMHSHAPAGPSRRHASRSR